MISIVGIKMPAFSARLQQFARFAVVGVLSNGAFYALYLLLTYQWLTPREAMTLTYWLAVVNTFIFNRKWTFVHSGKISASFVRYVTAYAIGYCFNAGLLTALVDYHGLPHQTVQALAVVGVAVMLFLLQKHWVFRSIPDKPPLAQTIEKDLPTP